MKRGFYPKLAVSGISKNRKLYIPYILTCAGMVMMFYIVSFLSQSHTVDKMRGGSIIQETLTLGCIIIAVFSLLLLFYTNSFLLKRRKKEFGLYNILGMGKHNIAKVILWENIIIFLISLAGGLFCGILFSKAAELLIMKILRSPVNFGIVIEPIAVVTTAVVYALIFFLILLNSLVQIYRLDPVNLLKSEAVGEKPPKTNWILAAAGVIMLACAYAIALQIKEPLSGIVWFLAAVLMVIVATYLIFISTCVAVCKILKGRKRYYYKTNHFVSVSSMSYRMKRNGAGLASICILSTMVLVMLSSTVCLYVGMDDSLRSRYPRDIVIDTAGFDSEEVRTMTQTVLKNKGLSAENVLYYRYLSFGAYFDGDDVILDREKTSLSNVDAISGVRMVFIITLSDYNRIMDAKETLKQDEVIIYSTKSDYTEQMFNIDGYRPLRVKKTISNFISQGSDAMSVLSSVFLIVPDESVMKDIYAIQKTVYKDFASQIQDYYGFDLDISDAQQVAAAEEILSGLREMKPENADKVYKTSIEAVAWDKEEFFAINGGLFVLGILLSTVFVCGAALIMYYKQIIEGYEDQARFDILRKVGMTDREIKKSINSQILTVFFMPLLTAGVHVAFAFSPISKLMVLFNVTNIPLLAITTVVCFLVFSAFYAMVYFATSKTYYGIISSKTN